jgi:hypothetical protein
MKKHKLYLIPGFLTDKTIYQDFLKDERFDCEVLEFIATLSAEESIEDYAARMSQGIDASKDFSLLGTSFGGILSVEISKHISPQNVIFISSIKKPQRNESADEMGKKFFAAGFYTEQKWLKKPSKRAMQLVVKLYQICAK